METIRIEISAEQQSMIARALYAYRMRNNISNRESWKFEDLADKFVDPKSWTENDDSVFLFYTPEEK